jgi:hypothetical protein
MIRIFTILSLILGSFAGHSQESLFYKDAVQLAARMVEEQETEVIPQDLIHQIEDALAAVSESNSSAASAVIYKYDIHALGSTNTSNIRLVVDKGADWVNDLEKTPIHKAFPNKKIFEIKEGESTADFTVLELTGKQPLNMKYLANEVSIVNDVWMVEIPVEKKDGNDIQIKKIPNGYLFTFAYKFKNCEIGCEEAHYWEFSVINGETVEFISEYGSDLPTIKKNNLFTIIDEDGM